MKHFDHERAAAFAAEVRDWKVWPYDLVGPQMPKRKFRRFTKRKQKRRAEQHAVDAAYTLGGELALHAVREGLLRRNFRCPRCEGHGSDPEHYETIREGDGTPIGQEPCACDMCLGDSVVGPDWLPWEVRHARAGSAGASGAWVVEEYA